MSAGQDFVGNAHGDLLRAHAEAGGEQAGAVLELLDSGA